MLTETARVVALDTEAVWVETLRQTSCGSCAARSGCGHGMLNTAKSGASRGLIKVLPPRDRSLAVKLHDTVVVAMPERGFLRAAWMLYAMPMLMTVAAAVAADQLWTSPSMSQAVSDLRVTLAAMLGLGLGLLLLRVLSDRMSRDPDVQPRITGIS